MWGVGHVGVVCGVWVVGPPGSEVTQLVLIADMLMCALFTQVHH